MMLLDELGASKVLLGPPDGRLAHQGGWLEPWTSQSVSKYFHTSEPTGGLIGAPNLASWRRVVWREAVVAASASQKGEAEVPGGHGQVWTGVGRRLQASQASSTRRNDI